MISYTWTMKCPSCAGKMQFPTAAIWRDAFTKNSWVKCPKCSNSVSPSLASSEVRTV